MRRLLAPCRDPLAVVLLVALVALPVHATDRGAVASACPLATRAGEEILDDGGNAVDAAVATALALAVTFPQAGNLGGGGFAVARIGDDVVALDFREVAPAAATRGMYIDEQGEPREGASLVGPLAAGVPGSPGGLFELHDEHGRLPWRRVVEPALRLAENGFVVSPRLARDLEAARDLLLRFESTKRIWWRAGRLPVAGERVRQPALARTLRAYARRGPAAITSGRIAREIERGSREHGGILTIADLETYEPAWREPVRARLADWDLASMPLPSSGGTLLGVTLGLLERLEWASYPAQGIDRAHLLVESWRRAYAARYLLGDPATTKATTRQLLDASWLDLQAFAINLGAARPSSELPPPTPGSLPRESTETTHLSVVDAEGNAVALTTTLNGSFGSGFVAGGSGIMLNNEMDDFATAPGRPNLYGLMQGDANEVRPGRRMLSSMTPTVAWHGDEILALGSPGGSRIPTSVMQVLLAVLVDGEGLQAAVDRPRIHHQWLPDELRFEPGSLTPDEREALERRGHVLAEASSLGEVQAVRRLSGGGFEAAVDPRGDR